MRKFLMTVSIAALLPTMASASGLSDREKAFVVVVVTSVMMLDHCPNYQVVKNSAPLIADRLGVRSEVLPALTAAVQVNSGAEYSRAALMPEVTELVDDTADAMKDVIAKEPDVCARYGQAAIDVGLLRRK